MRSKLLLNDSDHVFMLVIDTGEEAFRVTRDFAINAASVTAIGAFERATLTFFNLASQDSTFRSMPGVRLSA